MSNLFGLDDSDGNEDWGQGHILCTFVHFVDLVKEYASQGNQEVNEKMKENNSRGLNFFKEKQKLGWRG